MVSGASVVAVSDPPEPSHADDCAFDAIYPAPIRALSRAFWTPVAVARCAARLLQQTGANRVLDVGSGVGKFVLVAATAAPEMTFVGVEHRRHLVRIARRAKSRLQVPNARFKSADAVRTPWETHDAFYFFNPFAENLFTADSRIDRRVELSEARFVRDVLRVERTLRAAALGTAVVTYHGMGGRMPASFELSHSERAGSDWLRLWVKTRQSDGGAFAPDPDDPPLPSPTPALPSEPPTLRRVAG
jgi:SAM-dependent methyltransferase